MPDTFLDTLEQRFGVPMPRRRGYDTVAALRAMAYGHATVFLATGGNFVAATPDTELPHPPRDSLSFPALTGRASLTVNEPCPTAPPGWLLLPSLRSHDQDNTTIYWLDERYRGVKGGRCVVFVHPDDITAAGTADGDMIGLVSEWTERAGAVVGRWAVGFRVAPRRPAAATYFPEANALVAGASHTPTSKSIVVRLEKVAT